MNVTVERRLAWLRHPQWQRCPECLWPINPAALVGGYTIHPNCGEKAKSVA